MIPGSRKIRGSSIQLVVALILLSSATLAGADPVRMVPAVDLREEARILHDDNLVLVLEFSSESCEYCRKLEALFLLPMQRNPDYDSKILVRMVSLDADETVIDFDGRSMDTRKFAARYGVSLTPTLLFLDARGVELSEKLVGIWSEDFYGAYIDSRIEEARSRL